MRFQRSGRRHSVPHVEDSSHAAAQNISSTTFGQFLVESLVRQQAFGPDGNVLRGLFRQTQRTFRGSVCNLIAVGLTATPLRAGQRISRANWVSSLGANMVRR